MKNTQIKESKKLLRKQITESIKKQELKRKNWDFEDSINMYKEDKYFTITMEREMELKEFYKTDMTAFDIEIKREQQNAQYRKITDLQSHLQFLDNKIEEWDNDEDKQQYLKSQKEHTEKYINAIYKNYSDHPQFKVKKEDKECLETARKYLKEVNKKLGNEEKKATNPHPRIFKNSNSYNLFESLRDDVRPKCQLADYSFIYRRMRKDGYIFKNIKDIEFRDFLQKELSIVIDKTKLLDYCKTDSKEKNYTTKKLLFQRL